MMLVLLALACAPEPAPGKAAPEPGPAPSFVPTQYDAGEPMSDVVEEAIALAPAWVRADLRLNLRETDADIRDGIAAAIVDLDEPWLLDEVAFSVAHTSPEMLEDRDFHPDIFVDNARWIDAIAPELAYVELVDEGEPGVDDDYWTTAVYQVEVAGALETRTLSREDYYWYVVHPRIEDEGLFYIDAWEPCSSGSLECPADPSAGMHWREFLWEGAEATCPDGDFCPVLRDAMGEATFLWSDEGGGVGAVGAVAGFMRLSDEEAGRWFVFGAQGERSIQPNRIYALGRGNCGEWGDMTSALARTALVPNYNVTPSSWDHTWNEFYDPIDDRWVAWEPVNWWFDHAYGAPYANYGTRGDAGVFHVTDQYVDDVGVLEVAVTDADGRPVDGATVSIFSPYEEFWWYAGEAGTDASGVARFPVTADKEFAMRVERDGVSHPPEADRITGATSGIAAGSTDALAVTLDASVATAPVRTAGLEAGAAVATLAIGGAVTAARTRHASYRYDGHTASNPADAADAPSWFVTDVDNYLLFKDGEDHDILAEGTLGDGATLDLDPAEVWIVVVVNDAHAGTTVFPDIALTLTPGADATWTGEVAHAESPMLRPGDHVSVRIDP